MIQRIKIESGRDYGFILSRINREINAMKDGVYEISIKPKKNNRSVQQNRYMWGVVYKLIAEHTGYTVDEIHQLMKDRFLSYERNDVTFHGRTSKLKTSEFEVYLENIRRFAAMDLGIHIPDPNEGVM